ncbi:MAG: hypothetical protein NTZ05_20665 [Chloroflexi bacterium]|nr:hypothetical protein [Chloroflexota bacterium]
MEMGALPLLVNYADIVARAGPPLWWDGQRAPRYTPFAPQWTPNQIAFAALVRLRCAECWQLFWCAVWVRRSEVVRMLAPTRHNAAGFQYGPPPEHDRADGPAGEFCPGVVRPGVVTVIQEAWAINTPRTAEELRERIAREGEGWADHCYERVRGWTLRMKRGRHWRGEH